ncbi:cupin [Candidatus Shapirobacteria bacterium CG08_land_8_20_14_0_20_39_18]|uniref:Cupin n=1 Tax=Candidatus Shapirobacteria bacterium CG08_land_8_20_14_0_20_39_18 TaxID=1974883 RepID=A0A2M6XD08_9BACT|nr:MAG: cupin [Candidatus Shapirobacteria bacterium CG08_land_8_20_14_0_20_39_18]PIY65282.1 MAG: cupin [Candidatus Shapirobacteria bacterium CG_4_10_14_0_8_um_filter_39_15]PJE68126.1 MAG: cupin [Candidatus Shapirobacteria bacterium CG10_big_fil_rev_8_21_14_0_10_38_8]
MKIEKPWGYEILLTTPDLPYTGKILHVEAGKRCSLQYHDQKTETLTLIRGQARLLLDDKEIDMETDKGYQINPMQKHRYTAITDCDLVEHSSPEVGNTIRMEDDYQRGTEFEEERNLYRSQIKSGMTK